MTVDDKDIKALQLGSDRRKYPTIHGFRAITLAEVKRWAIPQEEPCTCDNGRFSVLVLSIEHAQALQRIRGLVCVPGETVTLDCTCKLEGHPGRRYHDITPSHVWFLSIDGKARQAKVNGKVRTWKRQPNRVEIPLKYGLYEYATFTTEDIESGRLLAKLGDK